jgi:methyl-accepting chemotaxis protein
VFIEGGFRIRFIVKFCLLFISGIVILGFFLYFIGYRELGITYSQAISTMVSLKQILFPAIIISILVQVVIISIVAIFVSLFASHKIAGPIYRMEKSMVAIGEGDLSSFEISLRDKDQIQDLAKSFEEMSRGFQEKINAVKDSFKKIEKGKIKLDEMIEDKEINSKKDFDIIVSSMHEEMEGLKGALKEFHV